MSLIPNKLSNVLVVSAGALVQNKSVRAILIRISCFKNATSLRRLPNHRVVQVYFFSCERAAIRIRKGSRQRERLADAGVVDRRIHRSVGGLQRADSHL